MARAPTLHQLGHILDRCLKEGISVKFVDPPSASPARWEDAYEIAVTAYVKALRDVRQAIDGDMTAINAVLSPDGRFVHFFSGKDREPIPGNGSKGISARPSLDVWQCLHW
ncbi:MAG: hypothetical protein HY914_09100 [Desulfomonile tiedjei]|nr:hypothetical protein [Desulfomonile tiedjei]